MAPQLEPEKPRQQGPGSEVLQRVLGAVGGGGYVSVLVRVDITD